MAPSRPSFGRSSSAIVSLTKFFGTGVSRASVTYPYRRMLGDNSLSDDLLSVTLDPEKLDVRYLLYTVIPTYIVAFDAYLVEYFDDGMIDAAWDDPAGRVDVDIRQSVGRINVASFYDEILCRRAFDLSPAEVVDRVAGRVEHSRLVGDGAYLIVTSKALPTEQIREVCSEVFAALTSSR